MNSNSANRLVAAEKATLPRFRAVGDVTLDLLHRDARVDDRWLGFHPREFELLWHLAETPGVRVTKKELLTEVWRINFEPETNSVAVHVARVRGKLDQHGLAGLLKTHPDGGYFIDLPGDPQA